MEIHEVMRFCIERALALLKTSRGEDKLTRITIVGDFASGKKISDGVSITDLNYANE